MNAKLVAGLEAIKKGIELILESQTEGYYSPEVTTLGETSYPEGSVIMPADKLGVVEVAEEDLEEKLANMDYRTLKKFAVSQGVSGAGTKDELISRILSVQTEDVSTPSFEVSENFEVVDSLDEEDEEDEGEFSTYEQVVEACTHLTNEEIATLLASKGISAKGKREALLEKLAQAVDDGVIDLPEVDYEEETEIIDDREEEIDEAYIDDEGELHGDKEPYIRNEIGYCCGKPLIEKGVNEKNNNEYECGVCKTVYESE